jgi:chromosome segregation ATPase
MKEEYKKVLKSLDEKEEKETELQMKLNQMTIEKNKAIEETNSLKKQGTIFKNEYNSMERLVEQLGKDIKEKETLISTMEVKYNLFIKLPYKMCNPLH